MGTLVVSRSFRKMKGPGTHTVMERSATVNRGLEGELRYRRWRPTTPTVDLGADRELYRNRVTLTKKQALGVVIYGLVGITGGVILVVGSIVAVWVDLPRDGLKILFPLCLPLGGGILTLFVAVGITVNAAHRLLSKQP